MKRHEAAPLDTDAMLDRLGVRLAGLTTDSRQSGPGVAFAAYPGERHDGRAFIPQAIAKGAAAIFWEAEHFLWDPAWNVPNVALPRLKQYVGEIAASVHGHPSRRLHMTGVTGTNGKTSVAHWIAHGLSAAGRKAAIAGTLGNGFPGQLEAAVNTTPDAAALQALLAHFVAEGAQACVMEVSSHGLHQGRVNGCRFNVAVLTNLSRDHLDYHGSMEAYAAAKAELFDWPELEYAVLNLDDEFGRALAAKTRGAKVAGYGFQRGEVVAES